MKNHAAGLLVYRLKSGQPEVFIVHNGGPFWAKKDKGVWSLPKGEIEAHEDPLETAKREFKEETGFEAPKGKYLELGEVKYPKSSKSVTAWAVEGDFDATAIASNTFKMEWPPRSGKLQEFPEIDRGEWCSFEEAVAKLFSPNLAFLERLADKLGISFKATESEQGSLF